MSKRIFDLALSLAGLLLLAPFFLIITILIKRDSPGPVFFRQTRIGRNGKPFRIHKFRTMGTEPSARGPQLTIGADPRITGTGQWLRKYKLDELPQLLDVIQGSMSLVGPRPEVPGYVAHYPEELKQVVLSVRPGITDNASIEYRDESAILAESDNPEQDYIEKIMPIKLEYYRRYVLERSLPGDIAIILRTLGAVFR
ncbi:sugar transferase [Crocinitomicaceae bacterium]|nr:sugar transferase [Crocinitomicaceae bacterium]